ncbi:MAG: tetratricopeptide repeat protein, partial [Cyanobacteria bacterium P01_A01_bin.135]
MAQSLLCSVADASPPPAPELASRNATESENDSAQAGRQFEAGQAHYQNGQFAAAIAAYQRALAIWTGLGDQAAVAQTQYEMGRTLRNLNQYPEAIAAFR